MPEQASLPTGEDLTRAFSWRRAECHTIAGEELSADSKLPGRRHVLPALRPARQIAKTVRSAALAAFLMFFFFYSLTRKVLVFAPSTLFHLAKQLILVNIFFSELNDLSHFLIG